MVLAQQPLSGVAVTRAAREGVELARCPLNERLAPHRRGDGEWLLDELALSWAGGPTMAERHPLVMEHLREPVVLP